MASRAVLTLILMATAVSVSYAVSGIEIQPSASDTATSERTVHVTDAETVLASLTDQRSVVQSSSTSSVASRTVHYSTSTAVVPELTSSGLVPPHQYASSHAVRQAYSTDASQPFTKEVFESDTRRVPGTVLPVEARKVVASAGFSSVTRTATGTAALAELPGTVTSDTFASRQNEIAGRVLAGVGQREISDREPEVVFEGREEIIIASGDTVLSKISVTEATRDPRINLRNLLVDGQDGTRSATYPNELDIGVSSGSLRASVLIPKDATLTGPPGWDGVVDLPRFVEIHHSPAGTVTSSIYVGLEGARLQFDKPVRIAFHDRAGHSAAFESGGRHAAIDRACAADGAGAVEAQLAGAGECSIDSGSDLAVWTYHMTRFYTLLPSPALAEPQGLPEPVRIGGGGGGGGSVSFQSSSGKATSVQIRSVAWDCEAGTVTVQAGPDSDGLAVTVLSKTLGLSAAESRGAASPGYRLFEAPMDPGDDFIQVKALSVGGRDFASATEYLTLDSCAGSKTFAPEPAAAAAQNPAQSPGVEAPRGDPVPEPAAPEPAMQEQARAEPAGVPEDIPEDQAPAPLLAECGPGTARGADGACEMQAGGGGCLVATAAYGTELAPQVQALREVRDRTVLSTEAGRAFLGAFNAAYYAVSPGIADLQRQNPALKQASAALLAPALWSAGVAGSAEPGSEASVAVHGAAAVLLAAGAYGAPAALWAAVRRSRAPGSLNRAELLRP